METAEKTNLGGIILKPVRAATVDTPTWREIVLPSLSILTSIAERMTFGPVLDELNNGWTDSQSPSVFAALADGLRKRGELESAAAVVAAGLERFPGFVPGLLAGVRVAVDQGNTGWAEAALRGVLETDPDHPLAREMAGELAPSLLEIDPEPTDLVFTDDESDRTLPHQADAQAGQFVTESLAELYHRQGHLDQALTAYLELAERRPEDEVIGQRIVAIRAELIARDPIPLDSRESGGEAVADWLKAVASTRPAVGRQEASFDAFFQPPPAPAGATADFDAFQRWLKELEK